MKYINNTNEVKNELTKDKIVSSDFAKVAACENANFSAEQLSDNAETVITQSETPSFFARCKSWLEKFDKACEEFPERCANAVMQFVNTAIADGKKRRDEAKEASRRNAREFLRHPFRATFRWSRRVARYAVRTAVELSIIAIAAITIYDFTQQYPDQTAQIIALATECYDIVVEAFINAYDTAIAPFVNSIMNLFG